MSKIAIIDDDISIVELLTACLVREDYEVVSFVDSKKGLEYLLRNPVDGLILDIMMSQVDGLSILKILKEKYDYPIILLTAKTEQNDVLTGLYSGASDYVKKPFDIAELVQRLKIHLMNKEVHENVLQSITYRNLNINESTHEFSINNHCLCLTPVEFKIMKTLMEKTNQVISSENIFESVWGEEYLEKDSNTVSVHIRNIRTKIKQLGEDCSFLKTIWGVGYKIE